MDLTSFVIKGVAAKNKELGIGAFGRVFEVVYCGADFAAKEIHPILLEGIPKEVKNFKDNFLRECCLLSRCLHPNIVQFIGIYYTPNQVNIPTLVMEQMDTSLDRLIDQNGPIPLHSALSILHDVSLGMWYIHGRNPPIMHRGLSPSNILLRDADGLLVAKVGGFGFAIEGSKGDLQAPGSVVFMAPEALAMNPEYGLPIDVFSYGGVALCAVVGKWPIPSDSSIIDPKTRKSVPLSEVERRQQYLDKMIGEAEVLRPLVEVCLNNDPTRRPTMAAVSTRIKEMKKDYMDRHRETKRRKNEIIQQQDEQLRQQDQRLRQQDEQLQQQAQQLRWMDEQLRQKDQQLQKNDDEKPNWVVNRREIRVSEKLLGTGGWGSVREGTFRGCTVAVKCIDNEIISPYNLELFSREMNMAARCRHPNLMQFIAATDEGIPLIVTELMHTSLRKILQQGQLYSNQIIPILLGAACGLNYLHKTTPNPILHRDISSANILLNPLPNNQWHAKLSDFGSANFMRVSNTVGAGNPSYAAPEALKPEGPHTPAMDVFSFGVLMYEMCSRRFPTQKPNPSMLNNVKWDVTESRLVGMIRSCLSHEIQGRPSMDDLIFGLNR